MPQILLLCLLPIYLVDHESGHGFPVLCSDGQMTHLQKDHHRVFVTWHLHCIPNTLYVLNVEGEALKQAYNSILFYRPSHA